MRPTNKAALAGNPLVAINTNENGTKNTGIATIPWTGTLADGTHGTTTCHDWTSNLNQQGNSGLCGSSTSKTSGWTDGPELPCQIPYSLYCFEQ